MTASLLHLTPAEYRRDPLNGIPWLSQSIAHTLISKSPLHAWAQHPKLGGIERPISDALTDGTVIHKLLLGVGSNSVVVLPYEKYSTKASQKERDAVIAAGKMPIKQKDYDELVIAAGSLAKRLAMLSIKFSGTPEVSIAWEEQGRYGPVSCVAMLDLVNLDTGEILDFKSTKIAPTLKHCRKSMVDFGHYLQDVVYRRAMNALKPELEGRAKMRFVFGEIVAPYSISKPRETSNAMREMGEKDWRRAVLTWERCLREDKWPGPDEDESTDILEPMPYALTDAMEREPDVEEIAE